VTETPPVGLTLVSMMGAGWNCVSSSCSRSNSLGGGASYAPIIVTVNVVNNASSPQVNLVSVSGGGSASASTTDSTTIIGDSGPVPPVSGDFNRDGHPDLIWQNDSTSRVMLWYMGGNGGAALQSLNWISQAGEPGWRVAAVADFNGDGVPEIIWENINTYQVILWYMGGSGGAVLQSASWISSGGEPGWRVAGAADFNADGIPDILWENNSSRQVLVWYMGGAQGGFLQGLSWISSAGEPGWSVLN
jgi:FG-GAP-like repeat